MNECGLAQGDKLCQFESSHVDVKFEKTEEVRGQRVKGCRGLEL